MLHADQQCEKQLLRTWWFRRHAACFEWRKACRRTACHWNGIRTTTTWTTATRTTATEQLPPRTIAT